MGTTITARSVLLVAFADLCRDSTCKKPKGQALFFLVYHGYPEMLPTSLNFEQFVAEGEA